MKPYYVRSILYALAMLLLVQATSAHAHFVWLAPPAAEADTAKEQAVGPIQIYFAESPEPGDADLLQRLESIQAWQVDAQQQVRPVKVTRSSESMTIDRIGEHGHQRDAMYVASLQYGVIQREGEPYRLVYVAKTGPPADSEIWNKPLPADLVPLDVQWKLEQGVVVVTTTVAGQATSDCEVKLMTPDRETLEGTTDKHGQATFKLTQPGRYAIRVRHIDAQSGMLDDKPYAQTKTYATLTVDVAAAEIVIPIDDSLKLADLPMTLTSFGAARVDQDIYVYGGTTGGSHDYYKGVQSGTLLRLPLGSGGDSTGQWEAVAKGPELQGLALVSDRGLLYRIGGFEARNAQGEEGDLWSTASVSCFDPVKQAWREMPALPEPRSSFDAAVIDHTIYVVGGWSMQGEAPRVWHETAWKLDLQSDKPSWQAIAKQPFERRALAVASFAGKLYAIGGISSGDDTVSDVEVYDPATDQWSSAPALIGDDRLTGFGTSAFATGDYLYVSGVTGKLQRLAKDASRWEVVGQLPTPRFFHRMLPIDRERLLFIGGSNMTGRVTECDLLMVK